jgi:hypothetical protein
VGRGEHASDGFTLAEKDLELRGPRDFLNRKDANPQGAVPSAKGSMFFAAACRGLARRKKEILGVLCV